MQTHTNPTPHRHLPWHLQVWYGVPASATAALEEAVRDALPHLCAGNPRLMYQLVTALSPMELKVRVCVCACVCLLVAGAGAN